jgi:hypothetical protein
MGANLLFYVAPAMPDFDDDFTGDNGDPPNTDRWVDLELADPGVGEIQNNQLRLSVTNGGTQRKIGYGNLHTFPGDFDVQVDWTKVVGGGNSNWHGKLNAVILDGVNAGWYYSVGRLYSGNHAIRYQRHTPTQQYNEVTIVGASGKFRITRTGTEIDGYHQLTGGWVQQYDNFPDSAGTVQIQLELISGESNPAATFDFDNLISV